jgi:hypothetical protein
MARPRKGTKVLETLGAFEKNPQREQDRELEPKPPAGTPVKPRFLKGKAAKIWDEYAALCAGMGTLARGDEPEFSTWCCLQAEFESDPDRFTASRIAQKRALAERFCIAGAGSRAKVSVKDDRDEDPAEKYFRPPATRPDRGILQ